MKECNGKIEAQPNRNFLKCARCPEAKQCIETALQNNPELLKKIKIELPKHFKRKQQK